MPGVLNKIRCDIQAYARAERCQPNLLFWLRMMLLTPGFQFVFSHRLQEALVRIPLAGRLLRRVVWWLTCMVFSAEIAMSAEIEGGLYIPHPFGIVIGRAIIAENVAMMQNVTIGTKRIEDRAVPVIERGVYLGAGCAVIGDVRLGEGATVGANAVVLESLPAGCIAVGVPAKVRMPELQIALPG